MWSTLGRPGKKRSKDLSFQADSLRFRFPWFFLLVVLVLVILAVYSYAWAKKKVILVVDGRETMVQTFASTVGDLLQEQGIALSPPDEVTPPLDTPLKTQLRVAVERARNVFLMVDKERKEIKTCRDTVEDVLEEQEVILGPLDVVAPEGKALIEEGMEIKVLRVRTVEEEKEVLLERPVRTEADIHLEKGFSRVVQNGEDGLEKQRWQIVYHDGEEVERSLLEREVIKKPVERVVMVGSLQQVSRGGRDIRFSRALDMIATAYTYTGYNTASGTPPQFGVAAVDPQVIPLGSRLYIEGYGFARALDKGSAIKNNRIDVFLETEAQARSWGVRRVKVYVLE